MPNRPLVSHPLFGRRSARAGDLVYLRGTDASGPDGRIAHPGDATAQASEAFAKIGAELTRHGGGLDDIVDVVVFVKDPRAIESIWATGFGAHDKRGAAWTLAAVTSFEHPDALVSVKAIAHLGDAERVVATPAAQSWRSRYAGSAVVRAGTFVFVSGQFGLDEAGVAPVPRLHIPQARRAYQHLLECLEAVGATLSDALDFTSFHEDIRGAEPTLSTVYIPELLAGVDPLEAPTTSHLGATGLAAPGFLGTFRVVADTSAGRRVDSTPDSIWWKGVYPIAGAAKKEGGRLITVAGQVACNPDASVYAEGDPFAQAEYIWTSMQESLAGFGATLDDVVEITSYHKDLRALPEVIAAAEARFTGPGHPAWTATAVPGLWMEGYLHEIAAIAYLPE